MLRRIYSKKNHKNLVTPVTLPVRPLLITATESPKFESLLCTYPINNIQ